MKLCELNTGYRPFKFLQGTHFQRGNSRMEETGSPEASSHAKSKNNLNTFRVKVSEPKSVGTVIVSNFTLCPWTDV